jgi:hypothetical protein
MFQNKLFSFSHNKRELEKVVRKLNYILSRLHLLKKGMIDAVHDIFV